MSQLDMQRVHLLDELGAASLVLDHLAVSPGSVGAVRVGVTANERLHHTLACAHHDLGYSSF